MTVMTRPGSSQDTLLTMYEAMVKTRMCETAVLQRLATVDHSVEYLPVRGQEAVAAGTVASLEAGDRLVTTKRSLHELIACRIPPRDVVGMLLAPWDTAFVDPLARAHGVIFSTGSPGAGIPVAAGAALSAQVMASGRVVVASFGDGATHTGVFHEGANLAATLQLPLVLLCRSNIANGLSPEHEGMRTTPVASRAQGYGIPGRTVDGSDPVKVRRAVSEAVARARDGGGPTLVECITYRLDGAPTAHREDSAPRGDFVTTLAEDPVPRYERWLTGTGVDACTLVRLSAKAMSEVERSMDVLKLCTGRVHAGNRR